MATKKITTKKVVKTVKAVKPVVKKIVKKPSFAKAMDGKIEKVQKPTKQSSIQSTLKISVMDTDGKSAGTMMLPENIFGAKVNQVLMAQAVRVYRANQRQGNASTKTRGEVEGSTRKIYRQKGTGRARHGGIRAPIFVKGGIAHGPHPKDYSLSMPTKMKQAALFSSLTTQLQSNNIVVVNGLEKAGPKTKSMAQSLAKIAVHSASSGQAKTLVVMPGNVEVVYKAGRNISGVTLMPARELSTYVVLEAKKIVFMKDAIEVLEKTFKNI